MIVLPSGAVWRLLVLLGLGTFLMRLSFIQLSAWLDEFPPRVERALRFVPPAILAAIVFPGLFPHGLATPDPHTVAGGLAALVAWRTRNMMATIAVGMAVLWGIQFVW